MAKAKVCSRNGDKCYPGAAYINQSQKRSRVER